MLLPLAAPADSRAPETPSPANPATLRVLIVDDNDDLVQMLAPLVSDMGHDVATASDGGAAVDAAASYQPDGYEVAQELRRHGATSNLCLVAMTGWGQPEDRERTRAAGFDHHLTKPAEAAALERRLASITPRH